MGTVTIQEFTPKYPITMIGIAAGCCWGADTTDTEKCYKRGLDCLESGHGRTFEFPDVYMVLDGYSARVIREWYTHIGGAPTRLQASTRYINYEKGFSYITPPSISSDPAKAAGYHKVMMILQNAISAFEKLDIPREDVAMLLPLGMATKVTVKHNLRNLMDMSRQRMCTRAYWEYRELFADVCKALSEYSDEWKYIVEHYFMPKCKATGFCTEKHSCGLMPKREETT